MPARKTANANTATAQAAVATPTVATPAARAAARSTARAPTASAAKAAPVKAETAPAAVAPKVDKPTEPPKVTKSLKLAKPAKPEKAPKLRQKPVRDSFTMPEADFSLVATLKARALAGQRETRKSELLRAGLHALAAMDGPALLAALRALEPIKTGRPKKGH